MWTEAPTATPAEFRTLMSGFPTGVAVVTATDDNGGPHGMTCTSLASVSVDPPALLACLDIRSGTLAAVRHAGAFGVNLLHARARRTAEMFSSGTIDRFGPTRWQPSKLLGTPWLTEDAFASAECLVKRMVTVEDHVIVLGAVLGVSHADDRPLLYGRRQFSRWNEEHERNAPDDQPVRSR